MSPFFRHEMDYVFFLCGLGFMLLAVVCQLSRKFAKPAIPWGTLALFGVTHGLGEWLNMLAVSLSAPDFLPLCRAGLTGISFLFLVDFGRAGTVALSQEPRGKFAAVWRRILRSRWSLTPLVALAGLGALDGLAGLNAAARLALALPGGLLSAYVFLRLAKRLSKPSRGSPTQYTAFGGPAPWLVAAAVSLLIYTVAAGAVVPQAAFPPACWLNQEAFASALHISAQLIAMLSAITLSMSTYGYLRSRRVANAGPAAARAATRLAVWAAGSLLLTAFCGWAIAEREGWQAQAAVWQEADLCADSFAGRVADTTSSLEGLVRSMSGATWIAPALSARDAASAARARSVLDRYGEAASGAVCYLLDRSGRVVACSDQDAAANLVLPGLLQQAMEGRPSIHIAKDATRHTQPSCYVAYPVQSDVGEVIGAAVIEKDLSRFEQDLGKSGWTFLADSHGTILLANRPETRNRPLWPDQTSVASKGAARNVLALLPGLPASSEVTLDGIPCTVVLKPVSGSNWSVVRLQPAKGVGTDRLASIVITLLVSILLVGFFASLRSIKESQLLAVQSDAAKGEFLANMSHEIRTPMTAILGFADMLSQTLNSCGQCGTGPHCAELGEARESIDIIRRNGEHLLSLINDILDLSKIEAGKMELEIKPHSVMSLVADAASIMRVKAKERGIDLLVEAKSPMPATIATDAARVRQALINMVGNAVKFTPRGSVRIVTELLQPWKNGQPAVRIQVIDTGIGIARDKLPHLFQPFVQADASTSRKYGGTGLGLAISSRIAQLLNGELSVQSQVGQGSTFTLTIPTGSLEGVRMLNSPCEASHAQEDIPADHTQAAPDALTGIRVLLAEDGPDNQRLIKTFLNKAGAEVDVANNGRLAVEQARAAGAEYHVILMDMQMPEMDGYTASRTLRRGGYESPIIALTAHAMSGDRERCLAAGCNDYLAKPVDRPHLIALVGQWGRRMEPPAEPREPASAASPQNPAQEQQAQERAQERPLEQAQRPAIESLYADDKDIAPILGQFIDGLPGRLQAMQAACQASCHEEVRRLAHQLKGAGGGYGYPQLTEKARVLEEAAKKTDIEAEAMALAAVAELVQAIVQGRRQDTPATKER